MGVNPGTAGAPKGGSASGIGAGPAMYEPVNGEAGGPSGVIPGAAAGFTSPIAWSAGLGVAACAATLGAPNCGTCPTGSVGTLAPARDVSAGMLRPPTAVLLPRPWIGAPAPTAVSPMPPPGRFGMLTPPTPTAPCGVIPLG